MRETHTPPWNQPVPHAQGLEIIANGRAIVMVLPKGKFLPDERAGLGGRTVFSVDEECRQTAAFVVRACNAHDDLVDALKAALPELEELNSHYAENAAHLEMGYVGMPALDKVRKALAALAKAEGGQ